MNKIESTMVEMISCANENGYHNHAEGIQEALDRILDEGMLTELYGDAWYDGFMAAKTLAEKGEDLADYTSDDVMHLSENAEDEREQLKASLNTEQSSQRKPRMSIQTAVDRPAWSLLVAEGDYLSVRQEMLTRGGQEGEVISCHNDGVTLDFGCNVFGEPIVMSRGHHDIHDFMKAVRAEGCEWPLGVPEHRWAKVTPDSTGARNYWYHFVSEGTRGAVPVTYAWESYGEDAYEAKYPTMESTS